MAFRSEHRDIDHPMIPMHKLLLTKIKDYGDNIALIDGLKDTQLTYNELALLTKKTACGLVKIGVRRGDVIAFYSYNTVEWAIMYWAVMCTGAIIATVNPTYTKYELENSLKDTKATYIFTVKTLLGNCEAVTKSNPTIKGIIVSDSESNPYTSFQSLSQSDTSLWSQLDDIAVDVNDTALILHSSGTTGLPKGVMLSHYNLVANLCQTLQTYVGNPTIAGGIQMCQFGVLPFYHSYGIKKIITDGLYNGTKIVVLPKFEPVTFLQCIERHKISLLLLVPPMAIFMAKTHLTDNYDLSSVTNVSSGAAPLSKEIEEELKRKLGIIHMGQGYGMTEVTCSSVMYTYNMPRRPGSSGKLIPSTEGMVIDTSTGKALGPNKRGELWIRGPQVMKGYLNNPEATQKTVDRNGWLHTGDVAYYDKEKYIYIVDRIKELIKVKGFQVAPAELEALILTHPAVSDAGIVGIQDERSGEIPRAYVVKKPDRHITEKEIYDFVAERTAPFKHLKGGVYFTAEIPRLPSGKIIRRKLNDLSRSKL